MTTTQINAGRLENGMRIVGLDGMTYRVSGLSRTAATTAFVAEIEEAGMLICPPAPTTVRVRSKSMIRIAG